MKTNQILHRKMLDVEIRQDMHTGMFCATDLDLIGNKMRNATGLSPRVLKGYFVSDTGKEHIDQVALETGLPIEQLVVTKRGNGGATWVHPWIFVDMAMWYNPAFKVKIIKWLTDNLLLARDYSGDSFKEMMQVLTEKFPVIMNKPHAYPMVANTIALACGICSKDPDRWNHATEEQLKLRDRIQKHVVFAAELSKDFVAVFNAATARAKKELNQERERNSQIKNPLQLTKNQTTAAAI